VWDNFEIAANPPFPFKKLPDVTSGTPPTAHRTFCIKADRVQERSLRGSEEQPVETEWHRRIVGIGLDCLSQELTDSHQQLAIVDRLFKKSLGSSLVSALFVSKPVASGHDDDWDRRKLGNALSLCITA
jgi:hypothetical protein